MRESDTLKKQFGRTHDEQIWSQYKIAHNDVNRLIKQTKREYFTSRIDAAKMIRDQHGDLLMNFRPANHAVPPAYLTNRQQRCFLNGKLSRILTISRGVPQAL